MLPALLRDARGVSAVELALIMPFIALMIVGITDLGRGFSAHIALQQAIQRTLERAMVGTVQTDYSHLRTEAATAAKIPVERVTLDAWLECNQSRQSSFEGSCEEGQMVSRYVRISARADFKPSFRYAFLGVRLFQTSSNGMAELNATSAVRVQ
ncbi:MAG TPA: TadE/TadG family type IV pilus assembly protein [Allosphingosinicella sp.]|nr:TadE/TadG family type IV pilus assembly protein [Allosphingosinicella sp.]